jgi:hypothetical protein
MENTQLSLFLLMHESHSISVRYITVGLTLSIGILPLKEDSFASGKPMSLALVWSAMFRLNG